MRRHTEGFTLIELMIVIAIIAIIVAIALPAYLEYTIRSKNGECMSVAAGAKTAVAESFQDTGTMPGSNAAAGYVFEPSKYCTSVAVGANGVVTATTNTNSGVILTFIPAIDAGRLDWSCQANADARLAHLPASCR